MSDEPTQQKKRPAQDLYAVSAELDGASPGTQEVLQEIVCNTYQMPGVMWTLRVIYPAATVKERFIGKGWLGDPGEYELRVRPTR